MTAVHPAAAILPLPPSGRADRVRRTVANATLQSRQRLTPEVDILTVRPDGEPPSFRAGQYVTIGLRLSGAWVLRPYSPANLPGSGAALELLVRRVNGGHLTPQLWATRVGARVHLGPAKGLFRLLPDDQRTHLLVATGTGVAPIVSMAAELLRRPTPPPMVIVHGVRHAPELAFRHRIERWIRSGAPIRYLPSASAAAHDENGVAAGRAVELLPRAWERLGLRSSSTVAYLCGNPAVIERAAALLATRGMATDAIRREEYWPSTASRYQHPSAAFAQHMG